MRAIGVLTSGGDAPGMNACVRAVVRTALVRGLEVYGIRRGLQGLIDGDAHPMDRTSVANIIQRGGTILGTSRSPEFRTAEGRSRALATVERLGIDGLVLIGGEGTFKAGLALEENGGPASVGVPGTIDNDVAGTDRSLGFDTAVNTALEAIDRIRDTVASLERLHIVEVMGRSSGWIALVSGLAGGAEAVLVPETATDLDDVCHRILDDMDRGKRATIVVVSEGDEAGGAHTIGGEIGRRIGVDHRVSVLGHVQRGGNPTAADRVLGSLLGAEAVDALLGGARGVMVGQITSDVVLTPLSVAVEAQPPLDGDLLSLIPQLA